MDIKKLFDYEHALETQRPEFTQEENYNVVAQPDKLAEAISFSITSGSKEGLFIKFVNKDGTQSTMSYLNPILAKHLAQEISDNLTQQGFEMEERLELKNPDSRTYH